MKHAAKTLGSYLRSKLWDVNLWHSEEWEEMYPVHVSTTVNHSGEPDYNELSKQETIVKHLDFADVKLI